MKVIGLTGGIATGKSSAEEIFRQLGAYVIDADKIVHELYRRDEIKQSIRQMFGESIFDESGSLDRKKLAGIIFSDFQKRKMLEEFIHPKVNDFINSWIKDIGNKQKDAIIIVSVPLMIETGSYKNYQKIIVVYAPKQMQIERLLKKGYSYEEALGRINAQMDIDEKLRYADYVIMNTADLEHLRKEVERVFDEIKKDP